MRNRSVSVAEHAFVAVFLVALFVAGCDSSTRQRWGLGNETQLPPQCVDILCDSGRGSTCDVTTLSRILDAVLSEAATSGGSLTRVWSMGERASSTVVVAAVTSPVIAKRGRLSRAQAVDDFVSDAKPTILRAIEPRMSEMRTRHRSPIAESISRIALAAAPAGMNRKILVISDAREVGIADLECTSPTKANFFAALDRKSALASGSLRGISLEFTYVSLNDVDGGRCVSTLDRALRTRELWLAAANRAAASSFTYRTTDEVAPHGFATTGRTR